MITTTSYTSLRLLFYKPIDVDLFKACYTWSVLDLHVGEIYVFPVSHFLIPMLYTQKSKRIGMYSGYDCLLSLKFLPGVCVHFGIAIPTSSFNFIQLFLYLFLFFFYCYLSVIYQCHLSTMSWFVYSTLNGPSIEDGRCWNSRVRAKFVATPLTFQCLANP